MTPLHTVVVNILGLLLLAIVVRRVVTGLRRVLQRSCGVQVRFWEAAHCIGLTVLYCKSIHIRCTFHLHMGNCGM